MIGLTALLLLQSASGCRSDGGSVRCALAPPAPPATATPAPAPDPPRPDRAKPLRRPRARPVSRPPSPPDDAAIARHVAALAAIGDCTAVRTFLGSVGKTRDAAPAFDACIAAPRPMPAPLDARRSTGDRPAA